MGKRRMHGRKKAKLTRRQRERRERAERRRDEASRALIHRRTREARVLASHQGAAAPRGVLRTPLSDAELRDAELLSTCLECAVPIAIMELQRLPWPEVERLAREYGAVIAERGDVIQFRSKGTAEAFAALARGVACLAFGPGGITFMGSHYEAAHPSRARPPEESRATP